ncbi:unnamed protein product [Parajaminaea phylloscopi]
MSFVPPYRYITAANLASALLRAPAGSPASGLRRDIAIVDVRDDDFEGGNIIGARNVPSTGFADHADRLARTELKDVPTVIFHCSLSQARGPKSARIYSEARQAALVSGIIKPMTQAAASHEEDALKIEGTDSPAAQTGENGGQNILVLRDGFANFGRVYKDDARLVEKYDEESWLYR